MREEQIAQFCGHFLRGLRRRAGVADGLAQFRDFFIQFGEHVGQALWSLGPIESGARGSNLSLIGAEQGRQVPGECLE